MEVAGVPNRADFAAAEKSRARNGSENLGERRGIVIGHAEETMAAAVTGKDERGKRLAATEVVDFGQLNQVGMGRDLVPSWYCKVCPGPSPRADRDGARLPDRRLTNYGRESRRASIPRRIRKRPIRQRDFRAPALFHHPRGH